MATLFCFLRLIRQRVRAVTIACSVIVSVGLVEAQVPRVPVRDFFDTPNSVAERSLFGVAVAGLNLGCATNTPDSVAPDRNLDVTCDSVDRASVLGKLFAAQLAAYPTAAPAGGFSFSFDRQARVFVRNSRSFGASFAERPITNGRDRASFGFSTQQVTFDALDGRDLQGGVLAGLDIRRPGPLGVFPETTFGTHGRFLFVDLEASSTALFANYGLSDRIDATLVVPTRRVRFALHWEELYDDCSRSIDGASIGAVPCVLVFPERAFERTAAGIGDIAVRMKHNFIQSDRLALAYAVEVSLPTGDEADFLGTGKIGEKLQLMASSTVGIVSPILNVGFTNAPSALITAQSSATTGFTPNNREVNYAAGADVSLGSKMTVAALILGRYYVDLHPLERVERETSVIYSAGPNSPLAYINFRRFDLPGPGRLHQLIGNVGLKWNIARQYLIQANVLIPRRGAGLRSRITPVLGLDYTF